MRTFAVAGRRRREAGAARRMALRAGFVYSRRPDFVIALGGHGTFFYAEKAFPGVPKLLVRPHNVGKLREAMGRLARGRFSVNELMKLEARARGRKLVAVNDIVLRNRRVAHALRFDLLAGRKAAHLIADGVVIATPFGSGGYFYSVCRRTFRKGIGITANNPTTPLRPLVAAESTRITVKIRREDGEVTADSSHGTMDVEAGDRIEVRKSKDKGRMIALKGLDLFSRR